MEVSGLDIGWGQRMPLAYDEDQGFWLLQRELPERHYEYKYIIDENWTCNTNELVTSRNKDGHVSLICRVTLASSNTEETHNTLKFAQRAND